ncbi:MAG TPA: DUF2059 domain-containing protein, partial [Bacteroidia bacterium]|nr:DUF2059 domain-containing protein [Bacteroidia bacterium]
MKPIHQPLIVMKKYIFFLFICISTLSAFSQESPKRIKIKELLELTGSAKVGLMVTKSLIATFQNSYPKVEQKFWDDFSNEIKAEDMIDILVPIYDKYYTDDDLDQLIAFYKTP